MSQVNLRDVLPPAARLVEELARNLITLPEDDQLAKFALEGMTYSIILDRKPAFLAQEKWDILVTSVFEQVSQDLRLVEQYRALIPRLLGTP